MSGALTHHAGGAFLGLVVGEAAMLSGAWDLRSTLAMAAVSTVTAGGLLSQDFDNGALWKLLDKWIPDEWLGAGGPLQHRGILHWVAWPFVIAWLWHRWIGLGYALPVAAPWAGYGLAVGWGSHLILDFIYGKRVIHPEGGGIIVRAGVPLFPWWGHIGGLWTSSGIGSQTAGLALGVGTVTELNHLGVVYQTQVGLLVLIAAASVFSWLFIPAHR